MNHKLRIRTVSIISLYTVLVIFVSGCCISGCKSNNGGDAKLSPDPTTTSATLAWDTPTQYSDGTNLVVTDIKEYRVYFGTVSQVYNSFYSVSDPNSSAPPTSVALKNINFQTPGTYFFAVTAVDKNGNESDFSNEVIRQIN
jgi:hypothetical protein